jgi:hypothetical protein
MLANIHVRRAKVDPPPSPIASGLANTRFCVDMQWSSRTGLSLCMFCWCFSFMFLVAIVDVLMSESPMHKEEYPERMQSDVLRTQMYTLKAYIRSNKLVFPSCKHRSHHIVPIMRDGQLPNATISAQKDHLWPPTTSCCRRRCPDQNILPSYRCSTARRSFARSLFCGKPSSQPARHVGRYHWRQRRPIACAAEPGVEILLLLGA